MDGRLGDVIDKLFFVFIELENAFDRVPRELTHFALRRKDVPEHLVIWVKVVKLLSQLTRNYLVPFL